MAKSVKTPRGDCGMIAAPWPASGYLLETSHVSSEGKTTTNKALLIVTRLPQRDINSRRVRQGAELLAEQQRRAEPSSTGAPEGRLR
jgi:DNA primase